MAGFLALGATQVWGQSVEELKQRIQELEQSTRQQVESLKKMIEQQEAQRTQERRATEDSERVLRALQEQVERQQISLKQLGQTGPQPTGALLAGVENDRPFLRSADGNLRIELGGRLQVDYDVAENHARTLTGTRLADQFLVRRGRFELKGTFFKWVDLLLECEFTPADQKGGFCLNDAYLDLRFAPVIGLRAGQFKQPFSLEELTSDNSIDFVERSIINAVVPSRDIGAMLRGSLFSGVVAYDLSVFNGAGTNTFPTSTGKELAGRLTLAPFKPTGNYWLKGLQIAGDFTWGDKNTSTSPTGRTGARTNPRFVFFPGQTTRGDRTRWGADLGWAIGPAAVKFEYLQELDQRRQLGAGGTNLDEVTATGWYVAGTWLLTGEDKPLTGPVIPKRSFSPVAGAWGPGAWELALRYAELAFDSDDPLNFLGATGIAPVGDVRSNGVEALTAGMNWYLNSHMRYMLNWTQYWYDNPFGTPLSCQRLTCAPAQLRQRTDPTSWELLTRIQLWF